MTPQTIGFTAACVGSISFAPQVIKVWMTRETRALSLWANLLILLNVSLWMTYGLMIMDMPLIVANIPQVLMVLSIIVAKLIFK